MIHMEESDNGHFYSGHYLNTEKNIDSCLKEIDFKDCYMALRDEDADECPYCDAHDFLQGSCDLFARALHERFGYEVYEIKRNNSTTHHWYAKSSYQGIPIYIDIRGATTDFGEFLSGLVYSMGDDYSITRQDLDDQDIHVDWFDTGMKFAREIISGNLEFYGPNL